MSAELSDTQQAALRALCDTFVPSIKVADDPSGFWGRPASALAVDRVLAKYLFESVPEPLRTGLVALLDGLAAKGFVGAAQDQRESMLSRIASSSPDAAKGIGFFEKQTLVLTYGLPASPIPNPNLITYGSPEGQNPNWDILGYPGPVSVPRAKPKEIQTITPEVASMTLEADVCIVGSGAGGAVIAARLSELGYRVVVLEAGGHYNSADFHQQELWGYKHLWYKGGATPTANGTVLLLAGGSLGGGTEINWMNCVRTPDLVRDDWTRNYGLDGINTQQFEQYMDVVSKRIQSSSQTAFYNAQNLRMKEGCEKLGYLSKQTQVNWDPKLFQPLMAGYTGFGDQTGGKQTARRTFLLDAYRNGTRIIVHCRADRVLVDRGRAAGVQATYSDPQGRTCRVTVRAPQVVAAAGSLESPALLRRTGIGGPAVGQFLRVQPGGAIYGVYKDKQKGWWGSPMTANCEQFTDTGEGFGFYMEIPAFGPGFVASVIPWVNGRQHKEMMTKVPYVSTFIWFLRDRGSGQIAIDADGNSVPTYQLNDPIDQKNFRHASAEAIRIHEAAGAQEILFSLAHGQIVWSRGQNLEKYIDNITKQPLLDGAQPMISAHQLCSCRMGNDRTISVADASGELYDVKGVWVGDGGACPTSLGANPMITIMSLASRTADRMADRMRPAARQDFGSIPRMASAMADLDVVPRMASNMAREMVGMMTNPSTMLREMTGIMTNPMNMLALAERILTGRPGPGAGPGASERVTFYPPPRGPMYSHIIELTAKAGQAKQLADAIRDQAIPQVIRPSEGFVDEIVLLSDNDPNHVSAISFWRSQQDAERFYANGFAKVSAILQGYLASPPQRQEYIVAVSTNNQIVGWSS